MGGNISKVYILAGFCFYVINMDKAYLTIEGKYGTYQLSVWELGWSNKRNSRYYDYLIEGDVFGLNIRKEVTTMKSMMTHGNHFSEPMIDKSLEQLLKTAVLSAEKKTPIMPSMEFSESDLNNAQGDVRKGYFE